MPDIQIGVVGAGGFARFAATAFQRVPGVRVVAVTDLDPTAAMSMAEAFQLDICGDLDDLLGRESVKLVYIATPPYLHFVQSRKALLAGKHVICEKPAALKTADAEALVELASRNGLLYVVNLMQRYNPLSDIVKAITGERLLGKFLHGFFENYASDEFLGPHHWFWDPAKSGGIFIEHGVHFFDLFAGWLGEGVVISAFNMRRSAVPGTIIDRVQATVLYAGGLVNFYHGFDQLKVLDRQEMRLLFEHGEMTLSEWVPVKMKLHGLAGAAELKRIETLTETSAIDLGDSNDATGSDRDGNAAAGRRHIVLEYANPAGKQELYQQMLAAMLSDQLAWISDPGHVRVVDGGNAVQSLRVAVEATAIAREIP